MDEPWPFDSDALAWAQEAPGPSERLPAARRRVATEGDMIGMGFFPDEVLSKPGPITSGRRKRFVSPPGEA